MSTSLVEIEEVKALDAKVVSDLQQNFNPLFEAANKWKTKAEAIQVTSANQVEDMKKAREIRLELRDIRVMTDKTRKQLKEESLLKGKAIDGMANIIKYLIVPLEKHLEEQESFAEIQEQRRMDKLEADRKEALSKYVEDVEIYNVREMNELAFNELLDTQKRLFEVKKTEEEKMEKERIMKEQEEVDRRYKTDKVNVLIDLVESGAAGDFKFDYGVLIDTPMGKFDDEFKKIQEAINSKIKEIKEENEALKKQQQEKEKQEEIARKKQEKEEKERRELEQKRLDAERKKREELESKIKAEKEAEEKAKQEKEKQEKEAKLAPDKDKLRKLASDLLAIDYPELKTEEAKKILGNVKELMKKVNVYIVENIDSL